MVPETIAGAGGPTGAATVHRSEPDGYTIGIYNIPGFTVNQVIGKDMGFNLDEVTWIANLATSRYAVAVKGDSEIDSVEKLCSLGRAAKMSDTGASSTASVTTRMSWRRLRMARGRLPATSARPPVLTSGWASELANRMFIAAS